MCFPAIGFKMPGPLKADLARPDVAGAAGMRRQWVRGCRAMIAACIGAFMTPEPGFLDGQRATRERRGRPRRDASNGSATPQSGNQGHPASVGDQYLTEWRILRFFKEEEDAPPHAIQRPVVRNRAGLKLCL